MHTRTLAGRLVPALAGLAVLLGASRADVALAQTCTQERDGGTMTATCTGGPVGPLGPATLPTIPADVTRLEVHVSGDITTIGPLPAVYVPAVQELSLTSSASVSSVGSSTHALHAQSTHGHTVRAENAVGGTTAASGTDAYGVFADLCETRPGSTCAGDLSVADVVGRNMGTVSVRGDGSAGIRAVASGNARSVTAENRGTVRVASGTTGQVFPGSFIDGVPAGLTAIVGGTTSTAPVTVTNVGSVSVVPTGGYGLHGRHEGQGPITIRNGSGGIVEADIALKTVGGTQNSVVNEGTLRGRFAFGDGAETFVNDGRFEIASGTSAAGAGTDVFRNEDVLHLGTSDSRGRDIVSITGLETFEQTETGILSMDLFLGAATGTCADTLNLGGAAATFDGKFVIENVELPNYAPREKWCNLVTVDSSAPDITLGDGFLAPPRATVAVQLGPEPRSDGKAIVVRAIVNYAPDGLSPNRRALGEYLNRIGRLDRGDDTTHVLHPMTEIRQAAAYGNALDELAPGAYDAPLRGSLRAADGLVQELLETRCPYDLPTAGPRANCVWASGGYRQHTRGREGEHPRFRETSYGIRAHLERPFRSEWLARFAAAIERTDTRTDTSATIDGRRLMVGGVAERDRAGRRVSFGALLGYGDQDVDRAFPTVDGHARPSDRLGAARASPSVLFAALHAGIGAWKDYDGVRILPSFAARTGLARMSGVTENGGSGALEVEGVTDTALSLHPRIAVERELVRDGWNVRPRFSLGYAWRPGDPEKFRARFAHRTAAGAVDTTGAEWFETGRGDRRDFLDGVLEARFRAGRSEGRAGIAFGTSTGGDDAGIAAFVEGVARF